MRFQREQEVIMSNDMNDDDDRVGFRKPPKRTQFKPGQSGNPNGRPKGAKNFATRVAEVLSKPVKITQGKRQKWVRTDVAMLMRMREKGLNGDLRASDRLFGYANLYVEQPSNADQRVDADDEAVLAEYEAKIRGDVEASLAGQVAEPQAPG